MDDSSRHQELRCVIKSESTYISVKDFLESIVPGSVTNQLALLKHQDIADRWTPLVLLIKLRVQFAGNNYNF